MAEEQKEEKRASEAPAQKAEKSEAGGPAEVSAKKAVVRKKGKKNIPTGIVHILSTFNNTLITITDVSGGTVCWSATGVVGFKGARKSTPFAAQVAADDVARKALEHGMRTVSVLVSGPGAGRESAIRALQGSGLRINMIRDVTPIPHNGCRPPKRRRI